MIYFLLILIGWLTGVFVNHAANVLPLKERLWQVPFCNRRLNFTGVEDVSMAQKGDDTPEFSVCHTPRAPIAWSALMAILSRRQTCPACGKSIGGRAVAVELILPVLFATLYWQFGWSLYLLFTALYTTLLAIMFVTDLEHRLIQHVIIVPAILLAMAGSAFSPIFTWKQAFVGGAAGFIIFYALALLARGGLGEGDVTLSAFLGLIIGFPNIFIALLYGILLGGLTSVILLVSRRATLKTFIPYGPFLILAGWAVMVWNAALLTAIWQK